MQSFPSSTALATSLASARVGRGFLVMLSSIWGGNETFWSSLGLDIKPFIRKWPGKNKGIAVTHLRGADDGLAHPVAFASHHFLGEEDLLCWDFDTQISTRHHDAVTSLQDLIKSSTQKGKTVRFSRDSGVCEQTGESAHLRTPSWFSSLLMILMSLPFSPSTFLTAWTSAALRMKEANTMSTPCSTPNCRSLMSFSDTAGRSTAAPGRLTPFLLPSMPPLPMVHIK